MLAIMLLKRLIPLVLVAALIFFGYRYIHNKNVTAPANRLNPNSAIQGAQKTVQQSQNYQNELDQKARQYSQ